MKNTIKKLYQEKKEVFRYLLFGVLTTLVNYIVFLACNHSFGTEKLYLSNWIAWFISVLFAYITNRQWVFESKASGIFPIGKEVLLFFGARLFSGVLDMLLMEVTVNHLGLSAPIMKLVCNVFVVILNYILSKLIVFRKQDSQKP